MIGWLLAIVLYVLGAYAAWYALGKVLIATAFELTPTELLKATVFWPYYAAKDIYLNHTKGDITHGIN